LVGLWVENNKKEVVCQTVVQDIDIAGVAEKIFAVKALCFVIGGFETDAVWSSLVGYQPWQ
jgi:hypothetical protein